ncbi:cytochrome D ubiquinol oxidase subunit II [Mycolicibacterium sp. TY66]|uniref:cytochrome d ubiquinol oxidase subunit II n=1 Tax=Mycolicibacterium TaxID=1866885 RepID=UPI001BB3A020|nr:MULTISPECIES: cytochrome d ubiquinol oxidase subunit II [Mycolicibacterium]MCT7371052.1 cytochrome d ubiquinol oxidase subunit II [Mycolicibacterium llatzerense]BCI81032.1 cytochrome D ubiquinol oxidase subunit II [Mycolicibacterium sp. TY66]BCJ81309.1 cytochrome D ubiquinol oxidase subunit II [Mycolicibacterium sp. TY81]
MTLQHLWFVILAALFLGFFVLEGFDFGVGMLMGFFGRAADGDEGDAEQYRRAALNTIGPVWDGNEVWIITAGAAMFAAFPGMYATVFSGLYLPLLAILVGMIVRVCAIEWRGKIDDPQWRRWADIGIAMGSWLPAVLWGVAFASILRGLPVDARHQIQLSFGDVLNPYSLLGGIATAGLFAFHGAVFVTLKTEGAVHDTARRFATRLTVPVTVIVAVFGIWTQVAYGNDVTWIALGVAVVAQFSAVRLVWTRRADGWAFAATAIVVAAVVTLLFSCLYPNLVPSTLDPAWSLTIHNASSTPYTLKVMTWAALLLTPLVICYQGWTYWVFRQRISAAHIPASIGLSRNGGSH